MVEKRELAAEGKVGIRKAGGKRMVDEKSGGRERRMEGKRKREERERGGERK